MTDALAFCREYEYPNELTSLLGALAALGASPAIRSIILLGSTARGEFSWRREDGRFTPLSDVEMLLVERPQAPPEAWAEVERELTRLEAAYGRGAPLFHLDVSRLSERQLRALPPVFRHFEIRASGRVLAGEPLLTAIPAVTLENLDRRDLNEILLWRCWAIWLYMPAAFAAPAASLPPAADRQYAYLLARNLLDLPSWLLPRWGRLIAGFGPRVAALAELWPTRPEAARYGEEFPALQRECLAIKQGRREAHDAGRFFARAEAAFGAAWRDLAGQPDAPAAEIAAQLATRSHRHFHDRHWRRKAHEARRLLQGVRATTPARLARWLTAPKFGPMLNVLVAALRATGLARAGSPEAWAEAARASSILDGLSLRAPTAVRSDDLAAWLRGLRRDFAELLSDYFPMIAVKRPYWERLL